MDDPRFKRFATDPKFRMVPKKERKVKIDPRFKSMFNDKRFVDKVSVDKRGRPKSFATKENFEKFYELESSSESDSEDNEEKETKKSRKDKKIEGKSPKQEKGKQVEKEKNNLIKSPKDAKKGQKALKKTEAKLKSKKQKAAESESEDESDIDEKIRSKLRSDGIDYARGEGELLSDSSSDEDSSDDEADEDGVGDEEVEDKWGELDRDVERTDEPSRRVAVCNMDWDRIGAQDIFVALNSFCPPGESIKSVAVYMSEFGKKRLAEEDVLGPEELRMAPILNNGEEGDLDNLDDDGEIDPKTMERIRNYQLKRLEYYYAVAEFSSVEAADKVYDECDGMEYELSATKFDLRFISDDITFDEEPKEVCNQMPRPEDYKPKIFENTALKHGKVNLTWDETDPNRVAAMRKAFEADSGDEEDEDVKAYLANSSDDDDEVGLAPFGEEEELGSSENEEDVVNKYRALVSDIREKEKKSRSGTDMEVSWIPSDVVNEQAKKKELESMTPWEQYLEKKKEKRKAKKNKKKSDKKDGTEDEDPDKPFSDDELPDGFDPDDPFFKSTDDDKGKGKRKKDKKKGKKNQTNDEESKPDKSGLSLLLMESDDEKDHFDFKDIVKNESKKAKKRKNKAKRDAEKKTEDTFKIDLSDDRFSAIFKKAEFNVDPSNPNFKKTKSMEAFIQEKQRRRGELGESSRHTTEGPEEPAKKKVKKDSALPLTKSSSSLDQLVHAVKAKSNRIKINKK